MYALLLCCIERISNVALLFLGVCVYRNFFLGPFEMLPACFGRAQNQPRKRCTSDLLYALLNEPNPQAITAVDRFEKSLEIKKYDKIESTSDRPKTVDLCC